MEDMSMDCGNDISICNAVGMQDFVNQNEDDDDGGSGETRFLQYSICVNGIRQAATCSDGYVFYDDGCVPIEDSPECQLADDTEEEPYDSFDCSSKQDGIYSISCVNQLCIRTNLSDVLTTRNRLQPQSAQSHLRLASQRRQVRDPEKRLARLVLFLIQRFDQVEAKSS
ncbi:unnamed protein product [Caenorhabditis nigoni]